MSLAEGTPPDAVSKNQVPETGRNRDCLGRNSTSPPYRQARNRAC